MKTNVIVFKPRVSAPRLRVSASAVASLSEARDRFMMTAPRKPKEPMRSDGAEAPLGIRECRKLTGLSSREFLLGVSPSPQHRATLKGYMRSCDGDAVKVRDALMRDFHGYLKIGARHLAADQLLVMRLFFAELSRRSRSRPPLTTLDTWMSSISASSENPLKTPGEKRLPTARSLSPLPGDER